MLITPTLTLQNPSIYGERIPGCPCDGCEPIPPARPGRCLAFWAMLDGGWGLLNALDVRLLHDHTPQALQARGAAPWMEMTPLVNRGGAVGALARVQGEMDRQITLRLQSFFALLPPGATPDQEDRE